MSTADRCNSSSYSSYADAQTISKQVPVPKLPHEMRIGNPRCGLSEFPKTTCAFDGSTGRLPLAITNMKTMSPMALARCPASASRLSIKRSRPLSTSPGFAFTYNLTASNRLQYERGNSGPTRSIEGRDIAPGHGKLN